MPFGFVSDMAVWHEQAAQPGPQSGDHVSDVEMMSRRQAGFPLNANAPGRGSNARHDPQFEWVVSTELSLVDYLLGDHP